MSVSSIQDVEFLTLQRAAELFSVPVPTLRDLIDSGKLTAFKPTRRVLLSVAELRALIESNAEEKNTMANIATQNTIAGPLSQPGQALALVLNPGDQVALINVSGTFAGLQLAFDGDFDGGNTWTIPLYGQRTSDGGIDSPVSNGSFPVRVSPSAWQVTVVGLTGVRVRVVGIASGAVVASITSAGGSR